MILPVDLWFLPVCCNKLVGSHGKPLQGYHFKTTAHELER